MPSEVNSASPPGITLDPSAFIGHPADEVETTLQKAGLVVTRGGASDAMLAQSGDALVDEALASPRAAQYLNATHLRRTLRELEVDWSGIAIILRLRAELADARRRIAELEADDD